MTLSARKRITTSCRAGRRRLHYVQIDETAFAKFAIRPCRRRSPRGDDWRLLIDRYIDVTNRVLRGADGIRIGMHLCRQSRRALARRGQLRPGRGQAVQRPRHRFLPGIRPAAGRRFLAAAPGAEGKDHRARTGVDQGGDREDKAALKRRIEEAAAMSISIGWH